VNDPIRRPNAFPAALVDPETAVVWGVNAMSAGDPAIVPLVV
jgi:hypothetical protein